MISITIRRTSAKTRIRIEVGDLVITVDLPPQGRKPTAGSRGPTGHNPSPRISLCRFFVCPARLNSLACAFATLFRSQTPPYTPHGWHVKNMVEISFEQIEGAAEGRRKLLCKPCHTSRMGGNNAHPAPAVGVPAPAAHGPSPRPPAGGWGCASGGGRCVRERRRAAT